MSDPLVVVGDCLLDVDLQGRASRLCPDEPAPVVEDIVTTARPGGAGLAAMICARLGPTILVTALGDDDAGQRVRQMLADTVTVIDLGGQPTVSKTRVRVGGRTIARLDEVHSEPGTTRDLHPEVLRGAAAVLVSDYGLGITSRPAVRGLLDGARPTVWDPHPRGAHPTPNVTVATPNEAEAAHFAGAGTPFALAGALQQMWRSQAVAVTRGAQGAVLAAGEGTPLVIPAPQITAADTCGAGDAFAANMAYALSQGCTVQEATSQAVAGAGAFLAAGGVTPQPELPATDEAHDLVAAVRARGGRVVMAGGCFDLLHAGHVAYLQAARALGDCLIVALNSDDSVRALKGPGRPVVSQDDRARVLRALDCVDEVMVFEESTAARLLDQVRPDIFAKGGDYHRTRVPESDVVQAYGGDVVVLPTLAGRSTTHLVHAARSALTEEEKCTNQPA